MLFIKDTSGKNKGCIDFRSVGVMTVYQLVIWIIERCGLFTQLISRVHKTRSQVPVFLLNLTVKNRTLSAHVHQLPRIMVIWIFPPFSTPLHYGWWLPHPIASFNLHSKNCLQYIFTTSPGALSLRCNNVFHPLLTGKPADRTHDRTPLIHREWHVIQRMRRQCVPGPRPDLKEKLGPGNEANKSSIYCMYRWRFRI